jgi:SNF family Na+-dependent transporter
LKNAKVGMPLLIFGVVLAVRGLTLGTSGASEIFLMQMPDGLNFLWTPQFDLNIRFEGLDGSCWSNFLYFIGGYIIHCYAAYIDAKDDIAPNAVSTGFMNEFCEVSRFNCYSYCCRIFRFDW